MSIAEAKQRLVEWGEQAEQREQQMRSRIGLWGLVGAALAGMTLVLGRGEKANPVLKTGANLLTRIGSIAAPIIIKRVMGSFVQR
jgi:hypothetical protein